MVPIGTVKKTTTLTSMVQASFRQTSYRYTSTVLEIIVQ